MSEEQPPSEAPTVVMPEPPKPRSGGRRLVIVAIVLVAIIVIAIIGYAIVGYATGQSQVSDANKALNTVVSDQNSITTTINEFNTSLSGISTSASFDAQKFKTLIGQFVADSQASATTTDKDSAALSAADSKLGDRSWLTAIDKSNIDNAHARIHHAEKALTSVRVVFTDYVQVGQFWSSFADVLIDVDKLTSQETATDLTPAKATVATMKTHVDTATQESTAPGLPPDVHSLMVDFQSLTSDFGKLLDAAIAGDDAGITTNLAKVTADATRIDGYDFTKMSKDIDTFFKPYLDTYNSEMSAATA